MKLLRLLILSAYAVPMLAMQNQNQNQNYSRTKKDVQRKNIQQLQFSIAHLTEYIHLLENAAIDLDEEELELLKRFKIKLILNEQELTERYKRRSEFVKSDYKNLA